MHLDGKSRLLEIGCGAGALLSPLALRVAFAVGLDISLAMLQHCRSGETTPHLCVGNAVCLPFLDGSFDRVLCYSVLQYLPDWDCVTQVVKEAVRVCEPCGRIYFGDNEDVQQNKPIQYRSQPDQLPCLRVNPGVFFNAVDNLDCQILPPLYGRDLFDVLITRRARPAQL